MLKKKKKQNKTKQKKHILQEGGVNCTGIILSNVLDLHMTFDNLT